MLYFYFVHFNRHNQCSFAVDKVMIKESYYYYYVNSYVTANVYYVTFRYPYT